MPNPRVEIAVFTRDLRVHDNPVLAAAGGAERIIPVFIRDDVINRNGFSNARRDDLLFAGLADLDAALHRRGAALVVRRGDPVTEVVRLAEQHDVATVHIAADVSAHAASREKRLQRTLAAQRRTLVVHEASITCHPADALRPTTGDHYRVFTPYLRRWESAPRRDLVPVPRRLTLPDGLRPGAVPVPRRAPEPAAGEAPARRKARRWLDKQLVRYEECHDDLAADKTSRLSAELHLGFLSPVELVGWAHERGGRGGRTFVRQLAWRDFHHQVLAARPQAAWTDYRPRGDQWRDDEEAAEAWRNGRTGYPLVDAGMRELAATGWMHNRARLVVASFLTKTLYLDWRIGARHFLDHLIDGDLANNNLNWQWVAGTGTDTRPNRVLNPVRQAARFDPNAHYIRRWIPELGHLGATDAREPWRLDQRQRRDVDYPAPIVDLDEARERFLAARRRR